MIRTVSEQKRDAFGGEDAQPSKGEQLIHRRHRLRRDKSFSNRYDHLDRRVQKLTPEATHTYFYDGWLLVKEVVASTNGTTDVVEYHWGKDLSGTIGGAGGPGDLCLAHGHLES